MEGEDASRMVWTPLPLNSAPPLGGPTPPRTDLQRVGGFGRGSGVSPKSLASVFDVHRCPLFSGRSKWEVSLFFIYTTLLVHSYGNHWKPSSLKKTACIELYQFYPRHSWTQPRGVRKSGTQRGPEVDHHGASGKDQNGPWTMDRLTWTEQFVRLSR